MINLAKSYELFSVVIILFLGVVIPVSAEETKEQELSYETIKALLPEEMDKAEPLIDAFYETAVQNGKDSLLAKSYYLYGLYHYYRGELYLSIDSYLKALETDYAAQDIEFAGACWNNLGINYDYQGYPGKSIEAYNASLKAAEELNDSLSIGQSWINIGLLEVKNGELLQGEKILNKALRFFEVLGDTLNMALCCQNLAVTTKKAEDWEFFKAYTERALELFSAKGYRLGVAQMNNNLGVYYSVVGQNTKAESYYEIAIDQARQVGNILFLGSILINQADHAVQNGKYGQAVDLKKNALQLFQQAKANDLIERAMIELLDLFAVLGDYDQFKAQLEHYVRYKEEFASSTAAARFTELKSLYEHERHMSQIKQQAYELQQNQRFLILIGVSLAVALTGLLVLSLLYFKNRRLVRSLYKKNKNALRQTHSAYPHEVPDIAPLEQVAGTDKDAEKAHLTAEEASIESVDRLEQLFLDINALVDGLKLYKNPTLTLSELAKQLNTNETYISQAINQYAYKNFNTFINQFRIEEAQKLMIESRGEVVLDQLIENCGFNSKSTFYRLFKQQTGLTPSQYLYNASLEEE
ncbi:helix-turn-helix domain-containing protein [Phaeodactylibacter xiamenensis]|uniref:helix-turn-helix domain-containing protein n=1 Tax=Phaeodactylibacter xiamenensis TaxID=1524460 RepID=UPI003BAC5B25